MIARICRVALSVLFALSAMAASARAADAPGEVKLDYAYYNPVSLLLKQRGWLDQELSKKGIKTVWVLSAGSNKALEFLSGSSLDFGSTASAASLLGRANGNPIKAIYVFSHPEWTALVVPGGSSLKSVADLKGRKIAVTRGTDPFIFLLRALDGAGLGPKDVSIVPLQHSDGRLALDRGDVDAWAGLDPFMAQAELESGDKLIFRDPALNSYGVLNAREEFAHDHPDLVDIVLRNYERARLEALADRPALAAILAAASKLPIEVATRQIERTDLSEFAIGPRQIQGVLAAGAVLKSSGVTAATVDIEQVTRDLFDPGFSAKLTGK